MPSPYMYLGQYQVDQLHQIAKMNSFDYSKELNEGLEYVDRGIWQRRLISFLTFGALAPYCAFSSEKYVFGASQRLQRYLTSAVYCEAFTTDSKFRTTCEKVVQKFNQYIDRLNKVRADHNKESLSQELKVHIPTPKSEYIDSSRAISDSQLTHPQLDHEVDHAGFGGFEDETDSPPQTQNYEGQGYEGQGYKKSISSETEAHSKIIEQVLHTSTPSDETPQIPVTSAKSIARSIARIKFIPRLRTYKRYPFTNDDPMNMNLRPGVDIRVRKRLADLIKLRAI